MAIDLSLCHIEEIAKERTETFLRWRLLAGVERASTGYLEVCVPAPVAVFLFASSIRER